MSRPTKRSQGALNVNLGTMTKKLFSDYSYLVSFILIVGIAVSVNPNFFKWRNITNIFVQSSVIGVIALGMTMVITAGQIDISVGAQVAIISGFGIEVLNATHSIWLTLLFCMAFGALIGTFNGVLVAKGHMPAMIATLAVQTSCRAIINHFGQGGPFTVAGGISTEPFYEAFRQVANGSIYVFGQKLPYPMLMFIAMALIFGVIMQRTKLGKHIYAVGSNAVSARLSGVNVDRTKIAVFAITGLMCGFGSWIYASRLMAVAAASAGNLFEMDANCGGRHRRHGHERRPRQDRGHVPGRYHVQDHQQYSGCCACADLPQRRHQRRNHHPCGVAAECAQQ